ncbi:MAG: c-type cytochrome, partial [Limisphaerales bacterium]
GGTRFENGKMARFVKRSVAKFTPEEQEQLHKVILALSAEAKLPAQREVDQRDISLIAEGRKLMANDTMRCAECHKFHELADEPDAPDLTGYGSREWLIGIISNPAHERFYGERNDRMPAFADEGILDQRSISLIAEWLRGEWYTPEKVVTAEK